MWRLGYLLYGAVVLGLLGTAEYARLVDDPCVPRQQRPTLGPQQPGRLPPHVRGIAALSRREMR